MFAVGTILAAVMGFAIGWRGGLMAVLGGFLGTSVIAALDYVALHPEGINGPVPEWPWGATSFIVYTFGLAAGLIGSLISDP